MIICEFCAGFIKWAFIAATASFALLIMSFITGSIIAFPFLAIADVMFGVKVTFQQGMDIPWPAWIWVGINALAAIAIIYKPDPATRIRRSIVPVPDIKGLLDDKISKEVQYL